MQDYELTVLVGGTADEKGVAKTAKTVAAHLEQSGAKIIMKADPEKKTLAYPVNRNLSGSYLYWEVSVPPEAVAKLEQKLKLEENVIRYLIVRK